jgi:hypothetical protein
VKVQSACPVTAAILSINRRINIQSYYDVHYCDEITLSYDVLGIYNRYILFLRFHNPEVYAVVIEMGPHECKDMMSGDNESRVENNPVGLVNQSIKYRE